MKRLEGRTAVVTGAGGGIGRAVADRLARAGCHLALCDRNEAALTETAELVQQLGRRASQHVVDVSKRAAMEALVDEVLSFHGSVHVVVNNAGVTVVSSFETQSLDDFEWLMGVNFWGVVHGCKLFLPALLAADEGHIVNLSSVFGILGVPMQSAYCASKFAVRGLSESLRAELSSTRVGVTSVHPAGVATNIVKDARYSARAGGDMKAGLVARFARKMQPPELIADRIVRAIRKNQPRVLVARGARAIDTMQRASPAIGSRVVAEVWKRMQARRA
ncbi:MAG TPA: SDR family NAD(P)-dependent oxidoreductase [Polyangiaceae bacterium]|jgi:short-subunit dehydrogenase|nr:SDR family NAD(P)-dependent oxidoreductase [Polyangiaceae bacterium]